MKLNEILVMHHSHLDIGYTHSQPMLWEMQREYLDLALDFLDETAAWPQHSRPRWTCEVTSPIMRWLETAADAQVARFAAYLQSGLIGISGMAYNTTPLNTADQLARQLYEAQYLRERFGVTINTVNQHDVNGIPWSMVDLMIDSGIELFIMAINLHLGGAPAPRPSIFRWQGPSGREMLVINGNHYTMFDQLLYSWDDSIERMKEGLAEYTAVLEQINYPHDFLYLTTTNPPQMWDNAPPNIQVAKLIRRWNEAGHQPKITFITPTMLLERIRALPPDSLPVYSGDWTDYWNFGCASTAHETGLNQNSKSILFTAELLQSLRQQQSETAIEDAARRAWQNVDLFDEHTWGYFATLQHDHVQTRSQRHLKQAYAYEGWELSQYLLVNELEALADNLPQADHLEGVLLVNGTAVSRQHFIPIPTTWHEPGKRLRSTQFQYRIRHEQFQDAPLYGPVDMPPFSWCKIPFNQLPPLFVESPVDVGPIELTDDEALVGPCFLENNFYRLEFNTDNGRVTRLLDKKRNWELLDPDSPWTFFEFVHEQPDPRINNSRKALYNRDLDREKFGLSCWQEDWVAIRRGTSKFVSCSVEEDLDQVTLVLHFKAPGVTSLEQRITLYPGEPLIDLEARLMKADVRTPEAIYFAFPLNLGADWRCHFDTAGMPTELDTQQLPGVCRDWVTSESFVSVHQPRQGVTLFYPDAPMAQIGDFNFGRKQEVIPRNENPLLLAWPANNYWDTNFPASQPGPIHIRYAFAAHGPYDPVWCAQTGQVVKMPVLAHPVMNCSQDENGRFLQLSGEGLHLLHAKPAINGRGVIMQLVNLTDAPSTGRLSFSNRDVVTACLTNPVEQDGPSLAIEAGDVLFELPARHITNLRIVFD